jgi:hypothetical protein
MSDDDGNVIRDANGQLIKRPECILAPLTSAETAKEAA